MNEAKDDSPEVINPLGRTKESLSWDEKHLMFILTVALVALLVATPILSVFTDAPLLNVLIGLSPVIITVILDMYLTTAHFKPAAFWIILAIVHFLALGYLYFVNLLLSVPVNVASCVGVSAILGIIVTAFCWFSNPTEVKETFKTKHVVQFKPEKIEEYVQSIEDKCKAINFVIGRVYRNSNGANTKMRERLRVPSEWYNEFNAIKTEDLKEQQNKAKVLIHKIRDRLKVLAMKEKDVFSKQDINNLKRLARHKEGEDNIIDVLKTNDRDPVEHYYVSAVEFCDRILEELDRI